MTAAGRNDPCSCGSGKRYKHCCGRVRRDGGADGPGDATAEVRQLMHAALAAQESRRLDEAEHLYRQALALAPEVADALHMLGVLRYERQDFDEARTLILRALDLTAWRFPSYRHNLGLVIARANRKSYRKARDVRLQEYRAWQAKRAASTPPATPRVAIVIPTYNHEHFVAAALASVFAQTYRDIEIVVIDDGSSDGTADRARRALAGSPFPHRMLVRENRGAAATLNEGIALTSAPFVNILNSDDEFTPGRICAMVREVAGAGRAWGFSAVDFIDAAGAAVDALRDATAYRLSCVVASIPYARSTGFALLAKNAAVSSGNLFFSRPLWQALGGFRDLRYIHDWDFSLRALWHEEPVFVRDFLYRYRLHGGNTFSESSTRPQAEARAFLADYVARAAGNEAPPNAFAPSIQAWGAEFVLAVLDGLAGVVEVPLLRRLLQLADELEARASATAACQC